MNAVDPGLSGPVVLQGGARRILFAPMACRLVSHVHREHQVIFRCGGAATACRVDGVVHLLRHGEMILVNPWQHLPNAPDHNRVGVAGPARAN